jgi:hypothetical protein
MRCSWGFVSILLFFALVVIRVKDVIVPELPLDPGSGEVGHEPGVDADGLDVGAESKHCHEIV